MLLTGLSLATMRPGDAPGPGAIRVAGERIAAVGRLAPEPGEERVDCGGLWALPGFVQGHVHLCQVLFRGLAEGLPLLDWLERRVWPLEAAHDAASLRASARLGLVELGLGGTTTFQSMETAAHTEVVLEEVLASGLSAVCGASMMDRGGPRVPPALVRPARACLAEADALHRAFDGRDGRLHTALNPRFVLSCSDELLAGVAERRAGGRRVHTHAAEHPDEVDGVLAATGRRPVAHLEALDLLGPTTSLAHCVHLDEVERERLAGSGAAVLHCPSTNLKLGSGIAPVADFLARGIPVALGADGAPANNRLCALTELRQAALLSDLVAGPAVVPARTWVERLTLGGATALGLDRDRGSLEPGKRADIVLLDLDPAWTGFVDDPFVRLVYAAERGAVHSVLASGRFVVRDRRPAGPLADLAGAGEEARRCLPALLARASL
ncbi:MAG: amidohydrolase family protein [Planctomycetota bacterium]